MHLGLRSAALLHLFLRTRTHTHRSATAACHRVMKKRRHQSPCEKAADDAIDVLVAAFPLFNLLSLNIYTLLLAYCHCPSMPNLAAANTTISRDIVDVILTRPIHKGHGTTQAAVLIEVRKSIKKKLDAARKKQKSNRMLLPKGAPFTTITPLNLDISLRRLLNICKLQSKHDLLPPNLVVALTNSVDVKDIIASAMHVNRDLARGSCLGTWASRGDGCFQFSGAPAPSTAPLAGTASVFGASASSSMVVLASPGQPKKKRKKSQPKDDHGYIRSIAEEEAEAKQWVAWMDAYRRHLIAAEAINRDAIVDGSGCS